MADLRWNPVSVNFNDASALMRNAGDSISKAGTVFGELRKSILDEEQRAIENAYKQQVFDENVRQFGEKMGLERDQFAFNKDKWADELGLRRDEFGLNQHKFEEDVRHNRATEATAAQNAKFANLGAQLQLAKYQQEQAERKLRSDIQLKIEAGTADWTAKKDKLDTDIESAIEQFGANSKEVENLKKQRALHMQNQTMYTGTGMANQYDRLTAQAGIFNKNMNPYAELRDDEQARSKEVRAARKELQKEDRAALGKMEGFIAKSGLHEDHKKMLREAALFASKQYGLKPDVAAEMIYDTVGHRSGWFNLFGDDLLKNETWRNANWLSGMMNGADNDLTKTLRAAQQYQLGVN